VGTTVSISGSGRADVTVFGDGTVMAGNGTDYIGITGFGQIIVGSGNDSLDLGKGGTIIEHGLGGHDTIHIGSTGVYTITEQGLATVTGAFGSATISGGTVQFIETAGQAPREVVMSGQVTILGAGSTGSVAGSGSHTSSAHSLASFIKSEKGGQHLQNFVAGQNHLFVQTHTLDHLVSTHDISMHGNATTIGMDAGKTTIALHGINLHDVKH
jgi:hypothetical protein